MNRIMEQLNNPATSQNNKAADVAGVGVDLVNGDRMRDYGHPADDFTRTAGMMSALGFRFQDPKEGLRELRATDIPMFMILVKLSRECNHRKDDNVVDIIGYATTLKMVYDRLDAGKKP